MTGLKLVLSKGSFALLTEEIPTSFNKSGNFPQTIDWLLHFVDV